MRSAAFQIPGSAGLPIRGDVHLPDVVAAPTPIVVGIHGFKGFRRWGFWPAIAGSLTSAGFAFANFDMSHNGVGEGGLEFDEPHLFELNTWGREEEDLRAVVSALRGGRLPGADAIDVKRMALLGHSRGGGLAVVHAADDSGVRAVVALAPTATILRFSDETLAAARRTGFIPIVNTRTGQTLRYGADAVAELSLRADLHDFAANFASRLSAPLLVVHGESDAAVAPREGAALAAAAPRGEYLAIPDADHVLNCRHPWAGSTPAFETFLRATRTFLGTNL